ncbi:MAG TPA: hypothetical protein VGC52_04770 [Gemmatimonadaceae bacterium]
MNHDPRGFPWAAGAPSRRTRVLFSLAIGLCGAGLHYFKPGPDGGLSDFSGLWYGADVLLGGGNPYEMIGPGERIDLPSNLYYPAPALVAVMPFLLFQADVAGTLFVFLSAALLAFGMTADGWYRIPMLVSVPFLTAARLGQWSTLMTAAVFLPALAFFSIAKPQASLPVLAGSKSRLTWLFAVAGALMMVALSFALLPSWLVAWTAEVAGSDYFSAPILSAGGVFIALVLFRWRRPEAWLVLMSACLPQTWYPYNALILLVVAATYREACVLSLVSSFAWIAAYYYAPGEIRSEETQAMFRNVFIASGYLPATIAVLRRKNERPSPVWLRAVTKLATGMRHWRH